MAEMVVLHPLTVTMNLGLPWVKREKYHDVFRWLTQDSPIGKLKLMTRLEFSYSKGWSVTLVAPQGMTLFDFSKLVEDTEREMPLVFADAVTR